MILEAGLASTTHVFIKLVSICRWPLWPKENVREEGRAILLVQVYWSFKTKIN